MNRYAHFLLFQFHPQRIAVQRNHYKNLSDSFIVLFDWLASLKTLTIVLLTRHSFAKCIIFIAYQGYKRNSIHNPPKVAQYTRQIYLATLNYMRIICEACNKNSFQWMVKFEHSPLCFQESNQIALIRFEVEILWTILSVESNLFDVVFSILWASLLKNHDHSLEWLCHLEN